MESLKIQKLFEKDGNLISFGVFLISFFTINKKYFFFFACIRKLFPITLKRLQVDSAITCWALSSAIDLEEFKQRKKCSAKEQGKLNHCLFKNIKFCPVLIFTIKLKCLRYFDDYLGIVIIIFSLNLLIFQC